MANSSPPWAAYRALMACRLFALNKRPGVCSVGIGETLRRALAKLIMRAAGDQAKTACGNLQLCACLEVGIEGATHAVGQRIIERVNRTQGDEHEEMEDVAAEEDQSGGMVARLHNLNIETAGTEEEAAEGLAAALEMEEEEDRGSEGEEEGGGNQRALGDLEFLTQEAEPSETTLVGARNGFNKLNHLAMLWTLRHRWPAGARFALNCYRHWAQLLLHQPGEPPITALSK